MYSHPKPPQPLWGCVKRVIAADPGLKLRILAAAVFCNSPLAVADQLAESVSTPFECGKEHIIGLRPEEADGPSLVLTLAEFNELWASMWIDVSAVATLFQGDETKDSLFQLTAGQVIGWPIECRCLAVESSFLQSIMELLTCSFIIQVGLLVFIIDLLKDKVKQGRIGGASTTPPFLADMSYR